MASAPEIEEFTPDIHFPIGTKVTCNGLVKSLEINGCIGTIANKKVTKGQYIGRYQIDFFNADGTLIFSKFLLPNNLSICIPTEVARLQEQRDMMTDFDNEILTEFGLCLKGQEDQEDQEDPYDTDPYYQLQLADMTNIEIGNNNARLIDDNARLIAESVEKDALIERLVSENAEKNAEKDALIERLVSENARLVAKNILLHHPNAEAKSFDYTSRRLTHS